MIVTCPSCEAKYRADAEALAGRGGRVRCASCSHVWTVDDEALGLEAPAVLEPEPAPALEIKKPHAMIRERAEARRRSAHRATEGAAWGSVAALGLLVLAAAWLFRVDIVRSWPETGSAYAAIGFEINPLGLEIDNLSVTFQQEDGLSYLNIEGDVINITPRVQSTLPLRALLLDSDGETLIEWAIMLESVALEGQGVERFHTVLPDPPASAYEIEVIFETGAERVIRPRPADVAVDHDDDLTAPVTEHAPDESISDDTPLSDGHH